MGFIAYPVLGYNGGCLSDAPYQYRDYAPKYTLEEVCRLFWIPQVLHVKIKVDVKAHYDAYSGNPAYTQTFEPREASYWYGRSNNEVIRVRPEERVCERLDASNDYEDFVDGRWEPNHASAVVPGWLLDGFCESANDAYNRVSDGSVYKYGDGYVFPINLGYEMNAAYGSANIASYLITSTFIDVSGDEMSEDQEWVWLSKDGYKIPFMLDRSNWTEIGSSYLSNITITGGEEVVIETEHVQETNVRIRVEHKATISLDVTEYGV